MSDLLFTGVEGHEYGDMQLCACICETLGRHYPGHVFSAFVADEEKIGMVIITMPEVTMDYGYYLKLKDVYADPSMRCIMRAGGEMIERAKMPQKNNGELPGAVDGLSDAELLKARVSLWE